MENIVSIPLRGICKLWVDFGGDTGLVSIVGLCNEVVILGRPSVMVLKLDDCSDADLLREFRDADEPLLIPAQNIRTASVIGSPLQVQESRPELRPEEDPSLVVPVGVMG